MVPGDLSLSVERELSEVVRVSHNIAAFLNERPLSPDCRLDVLLCVEEALSNIIRHGGPDSRNPIILRARMNANEVEIELEDDGHAFDPISHPAPRFDLPLHERTGGGLGIYLVKRLMDRVEYARRGEHNHLTMAKKFAV